MMTRKNFNALAAALRQASSVNRDQWLADVEAVADVCEDDNSGFDRERFYIACGASMDEVLAKAYAAAVARFEAMDDEELQEARDNEAFDGIELECLNDELTDRFLPVEAQQ